LIEWRFLHRIMIPPHRARRTGERTSASGQGWI